MKKIFIKVKSLILLFLICTITMFTYYSERVYALDGRTYVTIAEASAITVETASTMIAGGTTIAIAPAVATALVIGAGLYGGYKLIDTFGPSISSSISSIISSLSNTDVNDYFYKYDVGGHSYVGLTNDGYSWSLDKIGNISNASSSSISYTPTVFHTYFDYVWTLQGISSTGVYYSSISTTFGTVKAGDTIHVGTVRNAETVYVVNIPCSTDSVITVKGTRNATGVVPLYIYKDGVQYSSTNVGNVSNTSVFNIGYCTDSGTIIASGKDTVTPIAPTPLAVGDSIALPVGTTSVDGITACSTPVNPSSVSPSNFTVVNPSSVPTPEPSTGTSPTIDPGTISEGIKDTLDVPPTVPTLDFSPLMVATQKFPFCIPWDIYDTVKLLSASAESPKFHLDSIKFGDIVILPEYDWDLANIPRVADILAISRWFEVICFLFFLYLNSRDKFIRG